MTTPDKSAATDLNVRNYRLEKSYDTVPYTSKPFAQTTPANLALIAQVFGLPTPAIAKARVLELGCASGGNLMPLAAQWPTMECVGIDLSSDQIEDGKQILKKLGLNNCTLHHMNIMDAREKLHGKFDYIICHGVFSWVPDMVREEILQIVQDKLSPDGVAYISYNVYPGWKMREVVREMMLNHAGHLTDPKHRLEQAKAILEAIKEAHSDQSAYGKLLQSEVALLGRVEDSYIYHEYLEPENHPMYFRDFAKMAGKHELAFLGEASIADMAPQRLGKKTRENIEKISAGNFLASEQYMDFFTNRTFRQSLLVHRQRSSSIKRNLSPDKIKSYAFSTSLSPDKAFVPTTSELARFVSPGGQQLTANAEPGNTMFRILCASAPIPLAFEDLVQRVSMSLGGAGNGWGLEKVAAAAAFDLLNVVVQGLATMHLSGFESKTSKEALPVGFSLARVQAAAGQKWLSNRLHQAINCSAGHNIVMCRLDGKHSKEDILAALTEEIKAGRLQLQQSGQTIKDGSELAPAVLMFFDTAIADFKRLALLQ